MTTILVDNKYCKIINEDDLIFLKKLDKHLSFKYAGIEFTPAFKNFRWDGVEHLLSKKLEFYLGLLDYVKDFYALNDKQLDIIDNRKPFISGVSIDLKQSLDKLGITPYDYQLKAVEDCLKYDRVIYKHPTGSGKSITAALITAKLNKSTAIYVISKELLYQFHELFSKLFNEKIGIVGDGLCDIQRISIVSIWSVGRSIGLKKNEIIIECDDDEKYNQNDGQKIVDYIKKVDINIFDECHICAAKTIRNIYKTINPQKIYGFSGTPVRDDGADLLIQGILGSNISEITATELIERKILSKPIIKFIYVKGKAHYKDTYTEVYSNNITNNDFRNKLIVSKTKMLIEKGYQVLVLFSMIKHGNILAKLFEEAGINFDILNGKDNADKRKNIKDKVDSKSIDCLLASRIYDIGIDCPTLSALVLTGPSKSSVRCIQRLGRILRDGKNKPLVAVIDFVDDIMFLKKHALIRKALYEKEPAFTVIWPIK